MRVIMQEYKPGHEVDGSDTWRKDQGQVHLQRQLAGDIELRLLLAKYVMSMT